jgi:hypothetical protein
MFHKIKKLPLLLILAILLAIGSSGFAFYQYKELQHFKDAGLFYDSNQKQVVLNSMNYASYSSTRFVGINEIKDLLTFKLRCSSINEFINGYCLNYSLQNQYSLSSSNFSISPQATAISENSARIYNQIQNNQVTSAKYYGWFGSDKVEFNINTPVQNYKYNGDYYSNTEKKTYNFVGNTVTDNNNYNNYNNGISVKTSIKLDEVTDGLITGKIDLFSQDNSNKLAGLSGDAVDKLSAENLYGTYTAKDQKQYDIFLTKNKETIDSWKVKEIKGKLYFGNTYGYGTPTSNAFIKSGNENYFSNENWNFKNLIDGQEVIIRGKIRVFTPFANSGGTVANYQPPYLPCNDGPGCQGKPKLGFPETFSTDLGIFNIESVEKI